MFIFILAGTLLIIFGIGNDGRIFLPLYGLIFLTLAAVIRVWRTFVRKPKSGG
jgi:hypothetical protein